MANKKLIEQMKEQRRQQKKIDDYITSVVPQIYACFALTLSYDHYGWTPEQIKELFAETQALWCAGAENGTDMLKWCEEETGISVESE